MSERHDEDFEIGQRRSSMGLARWSGLLAVAVVAAATMNACSRQTTTSDAGRGDGAIAGAGGGGGGARGAGGGGGSPACGGAICTGSQICVHPSCGGAPPSCVPKPDGGPCPTGWTPTSQCGGNPGNPGCVPPPCTPSAPFCAELPAACGGTPRCACLPTNICQPGGGCGLVEGRDVICQSA